MSITSILNRILNRKTGYTFYEEDTSESFKIGLQNSNIAIATKADDKIQEKSSPMILILIDDKSVFKLVQEASSPVWENSNKFKTDATPLPFAKGAPRRTDYFPTKPIVRQIPTGYISRESRDTKIQLISRYAEAVAVKGKVQDSGKEDVFRYTYANGTEFLASKTGHQLIKMPTSIPRAIIVVHRVDENGKFIANARDVLHFENGKLVNVVGSSIGESCVKQFAIKQLGAEKAQALGVGIGEKTPLKPMLFNERCVRSSKEISTAQAIKKELSTTGLEAVPNSHARKIFQEKDKHNSKGLVR